MATEKQIAAIAASLSLYLDRPVEVRVSDPESPWAIASHLEAVGRAEGLAVPGDLGRKVSLP
jgi:hypothetical protein